MWYLLGQTAMLLLLALLLGVFVGWLLWGYGRRSATKPAPIPQDQKVPNSPRAHRRGPFDIDLAPKPPTPTLSKSDVIPDGDKVVELRRIGGLLDQAKDTEP